MKAPTRNAVLWALSCHSSWGQTVTALAAELGCSASTLRRRMRAEIDACQGTPVEQDEACAYLARVYRKALVAEFRASIAMGND